MRLIKPHYVIESNHNPYHLLEAIEQYGRTCYKSEARITADSAAKFVAMLIRLGHESVLEHEKITVRFICDRGVSHELVRHRIASFSQESTRYVNYGDNDHIGFIIPVWCDLVENVVVVPPPANQVPDMATREWIGAMLLLEGYYARLIAMGLRPEQARAILPNSLKTEIVVTANIREWRLILKQRTANAAHPQMRELMRPLLDELKSLYNVLFDDIKY